MRLPPHIKAALQKLAEAEHRSMSNYIECVLAEHVKETAHARRV